MKEQPRAIYRSMQGKEIDLNKLINQNEMTVAIGNVKLNARGDELGPGGKIIRKREEIIRENTIKVPVQNIIKKNEITNNFETKSDFEATTKNSLIDKKKRVG